MAKTTKPGEKVKNTSIGVDFDTMSRLEIFCKKYGIETKKDCIIKMLDYFERTGISPHSNDAHNNLEEKLDAVLKLQADANLKLNQVQQITGNINTHQEQTSLLLENKENQEQQKTETILNTLEVLKEQTKPKKKWWQKG